MNIRDHIEDTSSQLTGITSNPEQRITSSKTCGTHEQKYQTFAIIKGICKCSSGLVRKDFSYGRTMNQWCITTLNCKKNLAEIIDYESLLVLIKYSFAIDKRVSTVVSRNKNLKEFGGLKLTKKGDEKLWGHMTAMAAAVVMLARAETSPSEWMRVKARIASRILC